MRRANRSWLPFVAAAIAVLVMLPSLAGATVAATANYTAKCSVSVRTYPKVSAKRVRIIPAGTVVTAAGSVSGGSYRADCPTSVSGTSWLKVVAINGRTTTSLYGRTYVYVATKLFKSGPNPTPTPTPTPTPKPTPTPTPTPKPTPTPTPTATPTPTPTTTDYLTNCGVRLRSSTSTSATTMAILDTNMVVTASAKVSGGSWAADCKTSVSGSTWYKVTAVGGKSVSSLYGVSAVYGATGLFRAVTTSGYKEGIDVSHWQGAIDWTKVKSAGKTFAFAKATEGTSFKDDRYDRNKAGAMGQGIRFGAYHFARPGSNNPVVEADWFVDNMGLEHGMLIPAMDLEVTGGLGPTALTNWAKAWLQRVTDRTGVRPLIYTSPAFWRNNLNDTRWFADNGYAILWVAHWNTTSPSVPGSNWGGRSWTFWQYSSTGSVPGISGNVDLNRYRFATFDAVTY